MIEIRLSIAWLKQVDTDTIGVWMCEHNIKDSDWDIIVDLDYPFICFAHEADAIAFRLRFGI